MSIVTYENVDTPVFEIDYLRYLFTDGAQGLWLPYQPDHLYADVANTVPAVLGGGIASFDDLSGNSVTGPQPVSTARPILGRVPVGGRRNLLVDTSRLDTRWVTYSGEVDITSDLPDPFGGNEAVRITEAGLGLSNRRFGFLGVENIYTTGEESTTSFWIKAISEHSTIAIFNGGEDTLSITDEWTRVWNTKLVSGSANLNLFQFRLAVGQVVEVCCPQIEYGELSPYQRVGNEYDITEAGVPSIYYARYDLADDVLPHIATLPAITDGTVILIGQQGIWIDEGYSFAGGNWSFGPTTYPNGPEGIIGVVGDMLDLVVLDRPLTADERDKVVAYGVKRGSAGLIELGPEQVVNGTFDTDVSGWSGPGGPTWEDGAARSIVDTASFGGISGTVSPPAVAGSYYLVGVNILENSGNAAAFRLRGTATNNPRIGGPLDAGLVSQIVTPVTGTSGTVEVYNNNNATSNRLIDDVSLRRLIMPGETP